MDHKSSPTVQKYSKPMLVIFSSGTMCGLQFLKFWMRPMRTSGLCTYIQLSENSCGLLTIRTTVRKSR